MTIVEEMPIVAISQGRPSLMKSSLSHFMVGQGGEEDDEVIRRRTFDMAGGLDLSNFLSEEAISEAKTPALPAPEVESKQPVDEAMGEMFDPFSTAPKQGEVRRDGTVVMPPETDSVTELAMVGEKRLHWGIMVSMIVVYSVVGWLVGTTLPPAVGFFGLLALAALGFILGERWIPDAGMRMLGITWVIITMKLLYGLAIDLHHWELWGVFPIDATALGGLLLALVGVNVWVSYHHDEDAIAAQATLVTLAIGSGAGAVYGEYGVAGGIVLATLLLHGLAWHRKSGNLTSLGIAFSNLWIGLHAFSNDWQVGALEIVRLDDALLLFVLLGGVNALNAAMAARFYREKNWFSDGLSLVGLGRPGLWSVSVGLGMVGALLALSANRADTTYSLALIMSLLACFGGSYLSVRGVARRRVVTPLGIGLPLLVALLLMTELSSLNLPLGITGYEMFTVLSAALTAAILLSNQSLVSDHVLWGGSVVLVILMTILVPAQPSASGGDDGRLLLLTLSLIHVGTAALALLRKSPSLAGVTILVPLLWVLLITIWTTGARTFNAANQTWEVASGVVTWGGWEVTAYLLFVTILQYPVNRALGESGVNLAARFIGLSEVGARLRDSGMLKLWNIAFILSLAVWLAVVRSGEIPGYGLLIGMATLLAINVFAECRGEHQDNPRTLMILFGLTSLVMQWKYGMDGAWMVMVAGGLGSLVLFGKNLEVEDILSLLMGFLTAQTIIFTFDQSTTSLIGDELLLSDQMTGWVILATEFVALGLYLPRAGRMEKLLKPAGSSAAMLMAAQIALMAEGMLFTQTVVAAVLFIASAIWLAAQGELRAELKAVTARDERRQRMEQIEQVQKAMGGGVSVESQRLPSLLSPEPLPLPAGSESPLASTTVGQAASAGETAAASKAGIAAQAGSAGQTAPLGEMISSGVEPVSRTAAQRIYHFDSEESARAADVGAAPIEAMSQAISVGSLKTVSPELYMQKERMKKRTKRRGDLTQDELLYGDIHHKPVVVLTFIAVVIAFGVYTVWNAGTASAGILVVSGALSVTLIAISRWRASSNELTLPDLLGIETPFAATIAGITLLHFTGRLAAGATADNQLDFAVLAIVLLLLVGVSLTGRKDLVHRIPAAIEWYLVTLFVARFAGAVMAGTMPLPVFTDPFTLVGGADWVSFTLPWLVVEGILLIAVVGWDWIEGVRRKHGLPDFHGAAGRGGWVMLVSMLSLSPVALVAFILGIRRSIQWKQPVAVGISLLALIVAARAFASWYDPMVDYISILMIGLGLLSLALLAASVPMRTPAWTATWSWDAHLLLPLGVLFALGLHPLLVVSLLSLSLVIWVAGILQLRRSLRVWGAADLVIALVVAALVSQGQINSGSLLLMGIALGIELGIVAWLGQKHEGEMAVD